MGFSKHVQISFLFLIFMVSKKEIKSSLFSLNVEFFFINFSSSISRICYRLHKLVSMIHPDKYYSIVLGGLCAAQITFLFHTK